MKYAIGKKVRVKSFEEIWKTLDEGSHLKGGVIYFNDRMKVHCGKVYEIKSYGFADSYYQLTSCESEPGNSWNWSEEWVEPVIRFKVGDLAVVRPDLIPGKRYGDEVFVEGMLPTKGIVVKITTVIGSYIHIDKNLWNYSDEMFLTLEEAFRPGRRVHREDGNIFSNGELVLMVGDLVEDKAWLPEIQTYVPIRYLEILPDLTQAQIDSARALSDIPRTIKVSDIDRDYEIKLVDSTKNSDLFNPIKNTKDYENQLQREKTRIRGAEIPEGSRVCSRKRKTAIIFGHLSNKARTGY